MSFDDLAAVDGACAIDRCEIIKAHGHTSHSKGITVYLTESSAPRPALLLSVKRDLHSVLYLYFQ